MTYKSNLKTDLSSIFWLSYAVFVANKSIRQKFSTTNVEKKNTVLYIRWSENFCLLTYLQNITRKGGKSLDFYQIIETSTKKGNISINPTFVVKRSKDLMVRGGSFYAVWDYTKQMWSTDEYDVQNLIDLEMEEYKKNIENQRDGHVSINRLSNFSSKNWTSFQTFVNQMPDNYHQLDESITFSNTKTKKGDYISKRLPYPLEEGAYEAYEEIMSTLYDVDERAKLEWAIGAIISGDAKDIQKFIVLYGEMGSGKSTFLNIVQKLFDGYYTAFEAKALASNNDGFSLETFKDDPLVAIQHDGDLSKIEDNTRLNSIVSHEVMTVNEKFKAKYSSKFNCFLFMGTNRPVKITDAKSGIIRRLIDVKPSLRKIPVKRYHTLVAQVDFELGAIAYHCLQVYQQMGKNYYSNYRPMDMMMQTDFFFNFVDAYYSEFKMEDELTLKRAYDLYKQYCETSDVDFKLPMYKFREELKSYFESYTDRKYINGKQERSVYHGFLVSKFETSENVQEEKPNPLILDQDTSIFDRVCSECKAQYASESETPIQKWINVETTLADLDTSKLHYVRPPENHIVIDFDLKDETGKKSMELNLEAASKWPSTYAEFSKSQAGIHLHYIYNGDVERLSRIFSEGIEIKVFLGQSSLRRKFTKANNSPISILNSGLPLKGEKMINFDSVQSEKGLRDLIARNLKKEIHPGTKPSIDFIHKILEDAYKSGLKYDMTDLRPKILAFANNSSNQSEYCIKLVGKMQFASDEPSDVSAEGYETDELIFFDVEVFPNLFIVCWKAKNKAAVKMINPTSKDIEELMRFKLIGFNCRRYDNHILYARYVGYDNGQLYDLSQKIIGDSKNCLFGEAYNISYTDVYDFASAGNKKGLKKFEIELGIHHQELGLPWDQEVPEDMWNTVADYCVNDVEATEVVFNHLSGDWAARQILAELSGLSVNDTTNQHSTKIVFGNNKNPQSEFIYTDLREMFPGYTFENGKSLYRGDEVGEGGYVYSEPGMYTNVAVLDVASMHPSSIEQLRMFGPYTQIYSDMKTSRLAIKHEDRAALENLLGGKLVPFFDRAKNGEFKLKDLSNALKTALNSAYGLTSAKFDNPFRDPRNKDNIVAKRGALFMIDLKYAVQEKGFCVAHIKTDSIKIPDATQEIIDFVFDFGKRYGYEFEHEDTYVRFCLVNDAVYIARTSFGEAIFRDGKYIGPWTATGVQFAQPYVFKTLFSKESITFEDMIETKSVTSALYLDMNEGLSEDEHDYHFIGKTGAFCPIKENCGGGLLLREKDGKYYAATGSKGYRWLEAEMVKKLNKEEDVDVNYYNTLVNDAISNMSKYGDFEWFVSDSEEPMVKEDDPIGFNDAPPWCKSGEDNYADCTLCNHFQTNSIIGNTCKLDKDVPF